LCASRGSGFVELCLARSSFFTGALAAGYRPAAAAVLAVVAMAVVAVAAVVAAITMTRSALSSMNMARSSQHATGSSSTRWQ